MARVKRGVTAHHRHKRLLHEAEGRSGTNSRLIRRARESALHALAYATRDRKQRKILADIAVRDQAAFAQIFAVATRA